MHGDEQFCGLSPLGRDLGITRVPSQYSCDYALLPEIRQNPLLAQSHHLMQSQLRSLGLTPGNWHYLGPQGIQNNEALQRLLRVIFFSCVVYLKRMKLISWCMPYSKEEWA